MRLRTPLALGVLIACLQPLAGRASDPAPTVQGRPFVVPTALDPTAGSVAPAQPAPQGGPVTYTTDCCFDWSFACEGHFIVGAGLYLIQPHFESNPAYIASRTVTTPGGVALPAAVGFKSTTVTSRSDFGYDMEAAPQIWVGYVGEDGFGGRVRWWHFDHSASVATVTPVVNDGTAFLSNATPALPSGGFVSTSNRSLADPLRFHSSLKLDVWDFEAIQDLGVGTWSLLISGGVRCAHLSQKYSAFRSRRGQVDTGFGGGATFTEDSATARFDHSFNGAGPVLAVEARRPLGDFGLSLVGNVRGAVLFGSGKARSSTKSVQTGLSNGPVILIFPGPGLNSTVFNDVESSQDDLVPLGELELGFEYIRAVGRWRWFAQAALVGQIWDGVGSATDESSNLGFIGLSLRAGVGY